GAINGLADAVGDTGHTSFMTPQERQSSQSSLSGSYVGIGAEMDTTTDGLPLVVGVFPDSPADAAGLHAGDILITLDGRAPTGSSSISAAIPAATSVKPSRSPASFSPRGRSTSSATPRARRSRRRSHPAAWQPTCRSSSS